MGGGGGGFVCFCWLFFLRGWGGGWVGAVQKVRALREGELFSSCLIYFDC